ncbi:MAG TPA: O-antigen ligase family protein [Pyrinomonadaceae bacterium]|nr:O-antigen ligase family protein [Pyrinomonadaceae bacterium]
MTRSRRPRLLESEDAGREVWTVKAKSSTSEADNSDADTSAPDEPQSSRKKAPLTFLKRGHTLTYAGLFLFTVVLYARPAEFYPSPLTQSLAFIIAVATLIVFVPTQFSLEGTLTARPREVNLLLLFCLAGLISIPLATGPAYAWAAFSDTFIRCVVIFIVMINAVRTEARLKGLLLIALVVGIWLSVGAINDYRLGLATVEDYRVGGRGTGIFGNPNDMALFLVTIVPVAIALFFGTRGPIRKILYAACALLMMAAIVLTYSRGGFLGLLVALGFLAWKLGRRHRLSIGLCTLLIFVLLIALAPGNYTMRLLSIFVPSLDPVGSSSSRKAELLRSIQVAVNNPVFGVGMGNYAPFMSVREHVTHNTYTEVAAEMGMAALCLYVMFVVTPLRRLGQVARETFGARENSRYYYLAVGLQASLLGYMVSSFFASVAYLWYVYYLVAYAVCLRRLYESETGRMVVVEKKRERKQREGRRSALLESESA